MTISSHNTQGNKSFFPHDIVTSHKRNKRQSSGRKKQAQILTPLKQAYPRDLYRVAPAEHKAAHSSAALSRQWRGRLRMPCLRSFRLLCRRSVAARKTMCPTCRISSRTSSSPRRRTGEMSASCCARQTKSQEDERSEGVTERESGRERKQECERGTDWEWVCGCKDKILRERERERERERRRERGERGRNT